MSRADATPRSDHRGGFLLTAGGVLAAIVVSVVVELLVAALARAIGASDDFVPLQAAPLIFWTVIGLVAGAVGWFLIRRSAADPANLLRRLVPIVVAVSFIPDLAMFFSDFTPESNAVAVIALMVQHVVVAVVGVLAYRRVMPLDTARS